MSDIPNSIEIHGYATPYNRPKNIGGSRGVEVIDRKAFAEMLAKNVRVPILWNSHDDGAEVLADGARLFADAYGLGFSAVVDFRRHWALLASMTQRKNPADQCSIGGFDIASEHRDVVDGIRCWRVMQASIDHITICRDAVYGDSTGAWLCHRPLDFAPLRIQEMNARWEDGNERARLLSEASSIVHGKGRGAGGDLSALQMQAFNRKMAAVHAIDRAWRNT